MPALTPARLEKVRDEIEIAAISLFVKQGFHGTSVRDIAKAAGISPGGLYAHYDGKEGLFQAILHRYRRVFASEESPLTAYLEGCGFPDDIPRLAEAIRQVILQHRDFWLLWYVDVLEFQGRHFGDQFLHDAGLNHPHLLAHLDALEETGRLRVEAKLAFRMVYMHLFNFMIVELLFGGNNHYGTSMPTAVDLIVEVFLGGLLVNRPEPGQQS
jgi:AcrR family transcriptional regulator